MGERPTLRVDLEVWYDDSEFPDCRGWRARVGEHEIGGTDLYSAGHPTMSAAIAAVEKWADDRDIDLTSSVLAIEGHPKREARHG